MTWTITEYISFYPYPAVKAVQPDLPPTLKDVASHYAKPHRWEGPDQATWAHEVTHLINADIRNQYRAKHGYDRINAFYCLENRAAVLDEPKITLGEVAERIAPDRRGRLYDLYLVRAQQWWNNQPLYVFDEWIAYYNDARVSVERGEQPHGGYLEFIEYAAAIPGDYRIRKFFDWQEARCRKLR